MTLIQHLNQILPDTLDTLEGNWRVDRDSSIFTHWLLGGKDSNPVATLKTKYDLLDDLENKTADSIKHFDNISSVWSILIFYICAFSAAELLSKFLGSISTYSRRSTIKSTKQSIMDSFRYFENDPYLFLFASSYIMMFVYFGCLRMVDRMVSKSTFWLGRLFDTHL